MHSIYVLAIVIGDSDNDLAKKHQWEQPKEQSDLMWTTYDYEWTNLQGDETIWAQDENQKHRFKTYHWSQSVFQQLEGDHFDLLWTTLTIKQNIFLSSASSLHCHV